MPDAHRIAFVNYGHLLHRCTSGCSRHDQLIAQRMAHHRLANSKTKGQIFTPSPAPTGPLWSLLRQLLTNHEWFELRIMIQGRESGVCTLGQLGRPKTAANVSASAPPLYLGFTKL